MTHNKINFLIDHIDPLGQGVFKKDKNIYFIQKSLPTESGVAEVYKKQKNIHFAKIKSFSHKSELRTKSSCPHYDDCNGCQFLHTDYDSEISFKENTFKRMSSFDYPNSDIKAFKAPKRNHYRNRIQLHYDLNSMKIGFIDPIKKKILEVPDCLMPKKELNEYYQLFLENWKEQAFKQNKEKGHVELYLKDKEVKTTWNKRYSDGGFTQVFEQMNNLLNEIVQKHLENSHNVLDLFAGDGNLSKSIKNRTIVDFYQDIDSSNKVHLDLYQSHSLKEFIKKHNHPYDTFIVDPPRRGFPLLIDWINQYRPEKIIYVSCHSATMFRDIKKLKQEYKMDQMYMIDLFPSTFHFEGITVLSRL